MCSALKITDDGGLKVVHFHLCNVLINLITSNVSIKLERAKLAVIKKQTKTFCNVLQVS